VGMLALRTGKPIEWDAKNMRATIALKPPLSFVQNSARAGRYDRPLNRKQFDSFAIVSKLD